MTIAKNITYEYTMTSQSDLKDIALALKELREVISPAGEYSSPEVPGYSVSLDILNTLKDIVSAKIGNSADDDSADDDNNPQKMMKKSGDNVELNKEGAELNKEYANDMAGIADMIRQLADNYSDDSSESNTIKVINMTIADTVADNLGMWYATVEDGEAVDGTMAYASDLSNIGETYPVLCADVAYIFFKETVASVTIEGDAEFMPLDNAISATGDFTITGFEYGPIYG